ncbi:hypothetical protein CARUB_v10024705mg, partial [Capsella rubella]
THGDEDTKDEFVYKFPVTCRLTYNDPEVPKESEETLRFFLNKKHYSWPLSVICEIYGFTMHENVAFPKFPPAEANMFWD